MKPKLCIEAGHGLGNKRHGIYDPGAMSGGVSEADVVLAYALAIKFVFREKLRSTEGAELQDALFLTRDSDSDVMPVGRRDDLARAAGCTRFISLHLNAGGGTGTETFYRDARDQEFARPVHAGVLGALEFGDRGIRVDSQTRVGRLAVLEFEGRLASSNWGSSTSRQTARSCSFARRGFWSPRRSGKFSSTRGDRYRSHARFVPRLSSRSRERGCSGRWCARVGLQL